MSDNDDEDQQVEKPFHIDRAKSGRAGCKKCKQKIEKNELRFGKLGHNPFGSGTMKMWHHVPCIFEVFKRQRATTRKIESPDDIGGWYDIDDNDRETVMKYFTPELREVFQSSGNCDKPSVTPVKKAPKKDTKESESTTNFVKDSKDNMFRTFRRLCVDVASASSYTVKTNLIRDLLSNGSDGVSFKGDLEQWCRLLLPGVVKVVYNLQTKQLIKIFSRILHTDQDEMLEDVEKGDVAETIGVFFEKSTAHKPCSKAVLTMQQVDDFLQYLSSLTREEDQMSHFTQILAKCTSNDLRMILRLVKHDLRINAGAKPVLDALHPDAYQAFQTSRDLKAVVGKALNATANQEVKKEKGIAIKLSIMTPVLPMLAQVCKSIEMALKKCPNGMYSEIKYDGERVQLHKHNSTFKYFSRSLKPVMAHKVSHFQDYIPKAFPHAKELILDAEVLMVDTNTGKPLPFGTLGKHKKAEFKDAVVCLFVFDCIFYNGESLLNKPLVERREILRTNMTEIKNHVMFSEMEEVHKAEDLEAMITKVFKLGLEGLVLKDMGSLYKPGKRHWLKVKKDYLFGGAMADSADLVVLGAWFGTGSKGGIMSSFLMGCRDPASGRWVTVTKVHGGHDDATLDRLQGELDVVKIGKDASKVPSWLRCTKTMVPDFVARQPKAMPVWEITGAEFTRNQVHTADGISVRFPRVTKIRDDKDWETATDLRQLKALFKKSKDTTDFTLDLHKAKSSSDDTKPGGSKRKLSPARNSRAKKPKTSDDDTETEVDTEDDDAVPEATPLANPLHDIFLGTVIQMPAAHKDGALLRRYVIAFGGVLYSPSKNTTVENAKEKVTHVVHDKRDVTVTRSEPHWAKNVHHVHINWLWDSIKLLDRQKETKYCLPH